MAQKIKIILIDDIDGSPADETVQFGLDGRNYEIDLTAAHAQQLRDALATYVEHGRRATRSRRSRTTSGPSPTEIREWAQANGYEVSARGRLSTEVREAYAAAHQ